MTSQPTHLTSSRPLQVGTRARLDRQAGFTIAEVTVALFILVIVLVGVLTLFDFNNKLSRVQTNITDMQQSLRISTYDMTRMIRTAGRGGLPLGTMPVGLALTVRNNITAGEYISPGDASTPEMVEGTDALTVRGVLTSSLYQVNVTRGDFTLSGTQGTLTITERSPNGVRQIRPGTNALVHAVQEQINEPLIIVSGDNPQVYGVAELDPGRSDVSNPNVYTIGFTIAGTTLSDGYSTLSPGGVFPPDLATSATFVGVLEEYRYYVRQELAIPGDPTSDWQPKLSQARVFPGTETPYNNQAANWSLDVADNIVDLQVSLGFDTPAGAGQIGNTGTGEITEAEDGQNDDWLFNGSTDDSADPTWTNSRIYYLRLDLLARTDRRDRNFQAPLVVAIEDHDYTGSHENTRNERMYRRRLLQSVIDLRNLG